MTVVFTKLSDQQHAVRVERSDGTNQTVELGGSLSGEGLGGDEMEFSWPREPDSSEDDSR